MNINNQKNRIIATTILSITTIITGCNGSESSSEAATSPPSTYACSIETNNTSSDLRIYQVMVESFIDGDTNIGHGTGYGSSHHNGDIQGIIDSLDYIKSLGMNAIWMTPVFNSEPLKGQDHWADRLDSTGYFATDYFTIDPRFGDIDKAKELVETAHKKGLYVFFDGVFGHHKANIMPSPTGQIPSGASNPVSYPESLPFYQEVAEYWIKELKIDGWRLDQAYQVPTDAWTEIRRTVDQASSSVTYTNSDGQIVNPLGYMVAEIWNNENYIKETGYGEQDNPALCSAYDFPVRYRVVETFAVNESNVGNKGGKWLDEGMRLHALYPDHAKPNLMLGNHDLVRFGDLLQRGNIANPEDAEYWQRYKAAISFQAAYTGPITLYYGDEIGDQLDGFSQQVTNDTCAIDGLCDDHVARTSAKIEGISVSLNTKQLNLKAYVTELMTLRAQHPALSSGQRTNIIATEDAYVDHKQFTDDILLYLVSTSDQTQTLTLAANNIGSKGTLTNLQSGTKLNLVGGLYEIELAPFEAKFLSVDQPSIEGPIENDSSKPNPDNDSFMAQCDNPTMNEPGPITETLYVVGDFSDSNWKHVSSRAFQYKGDGVYQVVVNEKIGSYKMQYASNDWAPQFTADNTTLSLGQEATLVPGGYGKDTATTIFQAGHYVWSLKFANDGTPEQTMIAQCP